MNRTPQAIALDDALPSRSAAVPWIAGLLLPSLGSVVFVVTIFHVLFLSQGMRTLFRDSDAGWHIRNGEAILLSGSVPRTDSFSYTHAGQPWYAWEWLADVLFGTVHQAAGPAGVALFSALIIAATAWGAWRLTLALGGTVFFAVAAMVPLLGTSTIHWLARPHLFSWLIGLGFMAIAERHRQGLTPARSLYALPLLSCLWANLHGSFLLGAGLLLVYAAGEWLRGRDGQAARRRFALAALFSLLATFVNPYGWRLHHHIVTFLQNSYLMDHIGEFRSYSFHSPGALYVELFLALAALGTAALFHQRAFGPALFSLALLHMSLYSARHLPTYAILMLPLFIAAITREMATLPRLRPLLSYSARVLAMDRQVSGAVTTAAAVIIFALALNREARAGRVGFDPQRFPARAADFLEQRASGSALMPPPRVFATDQWGGYLIYRFSGRMPVFIDGRSDFYGRSWLETYAQINEVKPGWDSLLRGYAVQIMMTPPGHALAGALRLHPDWRPIYADSVAALFERKN